MKKLVSTLLSRRVFVIWLVLLSACSQPPTPVSTIIPTDNVPQSPTSTSTKKLLEQAASTPTPTQTATSNQSFVKISGSDFLVENQPLRFIGANAPYFGFYKEFGLSIDDGIKTAQQSGLRVLRIYMGMNDTIWGAKSIEDYDLILDIAAKYGIYVIINLGDGCCYSNEPREDYFKRLPFADFSNEGNLTNFEKFIRTIVLHKNSINGRIYRDDPTILAWDIMNEPAVELFTPAELTSWLEKMTTFIKSIDPNHLLTIGINTSPGIYSTSGEHYTALNVPGLDYFSFHFNTSFSSAEESQLDSIRYRVEMLRSMGKPVVMEEFGAGSRRILPDNISAEELKDWVLVYKTQLDTAFSAGAAGALFWGWGVPETKQVLMWWREEDHDVSEIQFVQMLQEYQIPQVANSTSEVELIATPQPTLIVPANVYVHAICTLLGNEKQTVVSPGSTVVIYWGWRADSYQNLQDFISNTDLTVTLDGKNISNHIPFDVVNNDSGNFKLYWFAPVGFLSAGSHPVVIDASWKKMISDGETTYGPGGESQSLHDECEIIVK